MVTHTIAGESVSDVILRGVRVLAINDQLGPSVADDAQELHAPSASNARSFADHAIATLELSTTQAQLAISAAATGKLSLMLRAADDSTRAADESELAANASLRLTSPFWTTGPQAVAAAPAPSAPPTVR
jgi:Flp pilus assembly protein CpaB